MRLKILGFVCVCLLLFVSSGSKFNHAKARAIIQEDPEVTEQKVKQRNSMKDMVTIAGSIADFVTDNGITPEQDGTYDENSEFYKALSPFYVKVLPIKDNWGNNFRVYCGEACNGIYRGITGCNSRDFIIVSFGRNGKKEDWEYNRKNSAAGIYELETLDDFDKDIVVWNGSFVRAPKPKR